LSYEPIIAVDGISSPASVGDLVENPTTQLIILDPQFDSGTTGGLETPQPVAVGAAIGGATSQTILACNSFSSEKTLPEIAGDGNKTGSYVTSLAGFRDFLEVPHFVASPGLRVDTMQGSVNLNIGISSSMEDVLIGTFRELNVAATAGILTQIAFNLKVQLVALLFPAAAASTGAGAGEADVGLLNPKKLRDSYGTDAVEIGSSQELDLGELVFDRTPFVAFGQLSKRVVLDASLPVPNAAQVQANSGDRLVLATRMTMSAVRFVGDFNDPNGIVTIVPSGVVNTNVASLLRLNITQTSASVVFAVDPVSA
jgi:hypothetical protein